MNVSLCMIVKDEGMLLEKFLNYHSAYFSEIIIVDTGSSDNTIDIAKKFTTKVFSFKWLEDFSAARNFSIKKATKDWIIWLDPDEIIDEADMKELNDLLTENHDNTEILGISLLQRNYTNFTGHKRFETIKKEDAYNGSWKGYFNRRICKIFRTNAGISFDYPIHETVKESITRLNGKILHSDIILKHYPEIKSKNFLIDKEKKYLSLLEKKKNLDLGNYGKEIESEKELLRFYQK